MADPTYQVEIDFGSQNSNFAVEGDCLKFTVTKKLADAFNPISVGEAVIVLDNNRGLYSPENTGSPYYPMVKNAPVSIFADYGGSLHQLFRGFVDSYLVNPLLQQRTTIIYASDYIRKTLQNHRINLELGTSINVGSLFERIFQDAEVPFYNIASLGEIIPYSWFADTRADDATNELIRLGDYKVYMAGDGTLTVKNRTFGNSGSVVASLVNNFYSLSYDTNFDRIINKVNVKGWTRKLSTSVNTIAWLSSFPSLPASSTINIFMGFADPLTIEGNTPAQSVQAQVSSTDYRANTSSNGTGTNLTGTLGVVALNMYGASANMEITNGSSANGFLTHFQMKGYTISRQSPIIYQTENLSSQTVFGVAEYTLTSEYIQSYDYAKSFGDFLLSQYKERRSAISVAIKNDFNNIIGREPGDVLVVVESNCFISSRWAIQELTHEVSIERGLEHTLDMRLLKIV